MGTESLTNACWCPRGPSGRGQLKGILSRNSLYFLNLHAEVVPKGAAHSLSHLYHPGLAHGGRIRTAAALEARQAEPPATRRRDRCHEVLTKLFMWRGSAIARAGRKF